jgi:hypothetical protein
MVRTRGESSDVGPVHADRFSCLRGNFELNREWGDHFPRRFPPCSIPGASLRRIPPLEFILFVVAS